MRQNNTPQEIPKDVRKLARLLDTQFSAGKHFRFGIDPILGLIPGVGDFMGLLLSGGLVALASRRGVSRKLVILMSLNVFLDAVIGSIPVLGGIFDFFYKANTRNVRMLEKYYSEGKYRGGGKGTATIIIIVMLFLATFIIFLFWKLFEWAFTELGIFSV
ncbi:MAG TPA: DUF4112 domain-containing protein [Prolixibacteraceae bacterium]|nr:DUF4112 domain-containing protein [Prolixibacteraceae bacterium]